MKVDRLFRALRYRRRLSQREFAARCGLPRSTIERIEAGRADPRFGTVVGLVHACGCELIVIDSKGRPVHADPVREGYLDRAGRHFPAHLVAGRTPNYMDPGFTFWWGWHNIAFWPMNKPGDGVVPENTYWRRPKLPHRNGRDLDLNDWGRVWDDAT